MRIEIENLKKSYQGTPVLDIDRLTIREGKITAIVGPNGAGKSTLLNLIGNLPHSLATCSIIAVFPIPGGPIKSTGR